jgi:hypothetical protein
MLTKTEYTVDPNWIQEALTQLPGPDFKTSINQPIGDFFYDPWVIKDEFKNTVWEKLINSINEPVGEARIIVLKPQMSYHIHSDIDDRFHLNLQGESCYLIDFSSSKLHKLETDSKWHYMDAGRLHTASNYGRIDRVQLVVRKILSRATLHNPKHIKLASNIPTTDDSRFIFDNTVSPWLNRASKRKIINNFKNNGLSVEFDIEADYFQELLSVLANNFRVEL